MVGSASPFTIRAKPAAAAAGKTPFRRGRGGGEYHASVGMPLSGEDKNPKAGPEKAPAAPAARTVVGVPAITDPSELQKTDEGWAAVEPAPIVKLPAPEPSATLIESSDKHAPEKEDPNTGVDVKAMSAAEAERVLAWTGFTQEEIPTAQAGEGGSGAAKPGSPVSPKATTVAGALKKQAPAGAHVKTPAVGSDLFAGLGGKGKRQEPEKATKAGVAPQTGVAAKGRTTLLLDSSTPAPEETDDSETEATVERPPIVVPGTGAMAPKAVTQPPPWGEGAVRMAPGIPKGAKAPLNESPVEELSGSLLMPADATGDLPAMRAREPSVEELSGSLLVEDPPDGKGAPVVKKVEPPKTHSHRPPPPAAKPLTTQPLSTRPVPAAKPLAPPSSSRQPVAMKTQMGMGLPELPKATPPPRIDAPPIPPPPLPPPPLPPALGQVEGAGVPGSDREVNLVPRSPFATALENALRWLQSTSRSLQTRAQPLWVKVQAWAPAGSALRTPRPRWFYPAVAGAGLVVGVGLVGLLVSLLRHTGEDSDASTSKPTASTSSKALATVATVPATTPATSAPAPAPAATSLTACTVGGSPHVIAPTATLAAGVEVVRLADSVGVGFAANDRDAIAVRLDASSLSSSTTARAHSTDTIRRVTPFLTARGGLSLVVDADRHADHIQSRRAVAATPPVQLGIADGHVAWTKLGGPVAGKLWTIDGDVDALRGVAEVNGDRTLGIALRSAGAVWVGSASGTSALAPKGELTRIEGLGTMVGSPAVAINDGAVFVAWADRSASADPWRLRWVRFTAGDGPGDAHAFVPPAGGGGDSAMSPGIAALPGGRFLLVWTEGPAKQRAVRALTLAADGTPVGPPLAISNTGVNAGQGQAAVLADGHGVVAFLESTEGGGFQVVGTAITCAN
jgi:hypothetical protein